MPRLAAIVVALVLPGLALAQNLYPTPVDWRGWDLDFASPGHSTEAMRLPLTQSGEGFDCTGATSCVSWNGSALVETAGLTWTQNGTVPQVAANTLPTTASSGAAGPFSDANYYSNGTGADALDSTGDRFGCASFIPSALGTIQAILANGGATVAGHDVYVSTTGAVVFRSNMAAAVSTTTANLSPASGFSVACWWRTGTGISVKSNLGTTATNAAAGAEVSGTAYVAKVGRGEGAGVPATGTILHVLQGLGACPTPPVPFAASCEGWATYQMKRQFGMLGTRGEEISITRATTATNVVNGLVWNVPAAVPRVTTLGILAERTSTNYALNNRTHPKAAEASAALGTGAHVAWHEGTGTMTVANGTATTTGLACAAVSPGTLCTFTVTVGGTMALTTSAGTVTKAQIETGSTKSSEIPTAGTAVTRNADVVTVPIPTWTGDVNRWCLETTATPYGGRAWTNTASQALVWAGLGLNANTIGLNVGTTALGGARVYDNAAGIKSATAAGALTGASRRFSGSGSAGTFQLRVDGATVAGSPGGAGTGLMASFPTTLRLGYDGTGATSLPFDGYLRDVRLFRSPLCR